MKTISKRGINSTRLIINKKTKEIQKQYRHLINGSYLFLPINNNWEILK